MIIIITEFIKYASEKYMPSMSSRSGMLCNNKLDSYRDGFCSKNRDSNNFCIKKLKFGQLTKKNKQTRDKNINDSLGITEDTLFNRDVNSGYTLKYW